MFLPPSSQADEALSSRLAFSQRMFWTQQHYPTQQHSARAVLEHCSNHPREALPVSEARTTLTHALSWALIFTRAGHQYQSPTAPMNQMALHKHWGKGRYISSPQREKTCSGKAQLWPWVFVSLHSTAELIHNLIVVLWPAVT